MNSKLQKLIVFLLLFAHFLGFSQKFAPAKQLDHSNGLASEYIINAVNSPSGYLYVATKRGISKYDGYRFVNLSPSKAVWSQLYSKDNSIYYHDTEGLFQLNCLTDVATNILKNDFTDKDPNNDHFNNIFVDSKGRIWGTDFNYVKYFSPKKKKLKTFLMDSENKALDHYSIFEPIENEIWIASKNGLWVWDETSKKMQPHKNAELNSLGFSSAYFVNKNRVLLATEAGAVFEINPTTNQLKKWKNLPKDLRAIGFFSLQNEVFVYTSKKVYSIENKGYSEIYSSGKKTINNATIDVKTGIIWISTDKGLVNLSPVNPGIENFNFPVSDSLENNVISIVSPNKNELWALTDAGNIWSLQYKTWFLLFKNEEHKSFALNEVGNKIILSTDAGLFIWTGNFFEKIQIANFEVDAEIIKVLKISSNEVWVVYSHKKMQRYSWPNFEPLPDNFTNNEEFWKDNQWNDILVDKEDRIWLVGWMPKGFGINKYDPVRHYFQDISDEKINKVESVFVGDYYNRIGFGNNSTLLFSAYGGFNKVDESGKVIKKIDVLTYPILDPHIEGLSEDESGNIFFATGEGLYIYRNDINKVVRISKVDGLPTDNLLHAYKVLAHGKIAMGIAGGIVIINPKKILNSQLQNSLELSQIKINGVVKNTSKTSLELSKDQTDLTLYFSNLSFLDPTKTSYQYRFDNKKPWQELGHNPELSLNHISPGKYRIHIRAQDNLYNAQEKTLELSIIAHPPFFKSNLFYVLLLILIIALVILIQKYLSKRKQKEAEYLRKIKETEMQMLRSQMNPHFMFNTLNSINSYIIQNKTEDASVYLTTFSKLMRSILQNSKEQTITLENELQTLKLYIQLESARLEHSFSYNINVDKNITESDILVPPLIVQPFVENAIWHGLRNKSEKGNLSISVYVNGANELKIYVQDNGVGREKSAKLKTNQISHKSYGMEITRERLKMLDLDNSIEIEDLYDTEKNALGTKVIITLKIAEND